jgi:GNAT superfamily N-acetyltransferase
MFKIAPVTSADIVGIMLLQPPAWPSILPWFEFYLSSEFCFPKKCTINNKIIGIGAAIVHGQTAWLAHIIVDPGQRNKGVGFAITQALIDSLKNTDCETISLIATQLGEPVYRKSGFEAEMEYIYLRNGRTLLPDNDSIIPYNEKYKNEMLELDKFVSAESRHRLLEPHLTKSFISVSNERLQGFFLPTLGDGLIIAATSESGLEFLRLKYAKGGPAALPAGNKAGIDFLLSQGYAEHARGTRMRLGKKINWQADKIYSRIGGNLG